MYWALVLTILEITNILKNRDNFLKGKYNCFIRQKFHPIFLRETRIALFSMDNTMGLKKGGYCMQTLANTVQNIFPFYNM